MRDITSATIDYDRPVEIARSVCWVGCRETHLNLHSNPYLIVDGDEAVVIDGGSHSDFPSVMMKILQTGIGPSSIVALIYQSYDPRVCGSIPHLEDIIDRDHLKIISDEANHMFIRHHSESSLLMSLQDIDYRFRFSSGRCLDFINTPYAPSMGSFTTFDSTSGILFTSDLFSSYACTRWNLFFDLDEPCRKCAGHPVCPGTGDSCPVAGILNYHRAIMTSERALKCAIDQIKKVPFTTIAPQNGGIIRSSDDIVHISELLSTLKRVGIDGFTGDKSFFELGDTTPIRKRLEKNA